MDQTRAFCRRWFWRDMLLVVVAVVGISSRAVFAENVAAQFIEFPRIFVDDLTPELFNSTIASSPSPYFLVEFMAPWCPHCRHFVVDVERLGAAFNLEQPGSLVHVSRVNCVKYEQLCNFFGISGFPTLKFGNHSMFTGFAGIPPDEKESDGHVTSQPLSRLQPEELVDIPHTAEAVIDWLNVRLSALLNRKVQFALPTSDSFEKQFQQAIQQARLKQRSAQLEDPLHVDLQDVEAGATLAVRDVFGGMKLKRHAQNILGDFVGLLCSIYPSGTNGSDCRANWCRLQSLLRRILPVYSNSSASSVVLRVEDLQSNWKPCTRNWSVLDHDSPDLWNQCQGSFPWTRGYTCGLWLLFHTLTARMPDDQTAASNLKVIRTFVGSFFQCDECRKHFLQISADFESVGNRRDAMLWLWRIHNKVNQRVENLEARFHSADPAYPKQSFPPRDVCGKCRRGSGNKGSENSGDINPGELGAGDLDDQWGAALWSHYAVSWIEDNVYTFLSSFYGAPTK